MLLHTPCSDFADDVKVLWQPSWKMIKFRTPSQSQSQFVKANKKDFKCALDKLYDLGPSTSNMILLVLNRKKLVTHQIIWDSLWLVQYSLPQWTRDELELDLQCISSSDQQLAASQPNPWLQNEWQSYIQNSIKQLHLYKYQRRTPSDSSRRRG